MFAASHALRTTRVDPVYGKRIRNLVRWSSFNLISQRGTFEAGPSTKTYKQNQNLIYKMLELNL